MPTASARILNPDPIPYFKGQKAAFMLRTESVGGTWIEKSPYPSDSGRPIYNFGARPCDLARDWDTDRLIRAIDSQ